MPVADLSFNSLLLLEKVALSWLPGWVLEKDLGLALKANPVVAWYFRHKCPEISSWVDRIVQDVCDADINDSNRVRQAEIRVLEKLEDLLVYVLHPAIYDAQPFTKWDSQELLAMADFNNKVVIDVGAGPGKLTLSVAELAASVFAVEPVENLRSYLKTKAAKQNIKNVFAVDGLITDIPFPDHFADIVMLGHVFGDQPETEYEELKRVTKPGGMILLCPGSNDSDENQSHQFLTAHGFEWARFEEPQEGLKRKYWKRI